MKIKFQMDAVLWSAKQRLWKIIALMLFYSGILKLVRYLANGYQCEKNSSDRAVFPYIKKREARGAQILMYHRVGDEHDPFFPPTPTKIFARQM